MENIEIESTGSLAEYTEKKLREFLRENIEERRTVFIKKIVIHEVDKKNDNLKDDVDYVKVWVHTHDEVDTENLFNDPIIFYKDAPVRMSDLYKDHKGIATSESYVLNNQYESLWLAIEARGTDLTIKELFDDLFKKVKVSKKLAKKLYKFQVSYVTKNKDHSEFFGGGLIGTVPITFKNSEELNLFNNIFKVDVNDIKNRLKECPSINTSFKVTGDPLNLSIFYLVHRFLSDRKLSSTVKRRAAYDLLMIFNYRTISALHNNGFRFLASPEVSKQAYEELSGRFIIKQCGSWKNYMEIRANKVIDTESNHFKSLLTMSSDHKFLYSISDTQGRIRSTFKLMYRVLDRVKNEGDRLSVVSGVDKGTDKEENSDVVSGVKGKTTKMLSDVMIPATFVNKKMVKVISSIIPGLSEKNLTDLLTRFSKLTMSSDYKKANGFIVNSITYCYSHIQEVDISPKVQKDVLYVLSVLKGALGSSRSSDTSLAVIRDDGLWLVKKASNKNDKQLLSSLRSALILYIFLYTFV